MNFFQESVFLSEIIFQVEIAEFAETQLRNENASNNRIALWSAIQLILISSANVSKILWPSWKANKDRGFHLRTLLNIQDDNILKERKFRDHFEHYDERVEEWTKNKNGFTDLAMNPSLYIFGHENTSRGYNSFNNTLIFQGEILDLNAILYELRSIKKKCLHS